MLSIDNRGSNFGGLVLGCIDASDSESRLIFQHFSASAVSLGVAQGLAQSLCDNSGSRSCRCRRDRGRVAPRVFSWLRAARALLFAAAACAVLIRPVDPRGRGEGGSIPRTQYPQSLPGPFLSVSTATTARVGSFFSIFRGLQD